MNGPKEEVPKLTAAAAGEVKASLGCDDRVAQKISDVLQLLDDAEGVEVEGVDNELTFPDMMSCFAVTSEMFDRMDPERPEVQVVRPRAPRNPFFGVLYKVGRVVADKHAQ